ncbi:hypothetical protein [Anatilimnocola floriformis]|uniref:hypothetical protein n=1 Tax=Anatilimnocola floriformis TaxID=2948575 RepID=UPI0020C37FDA|nr:hypothetical protein [Anatilimnocola floriformis]
MPEVWLRTNRRALLLGLALPVVIALVGSGLLIAAWLLHWHWGVWALAGAMILGALYLTGNILWMAAQPRLAYEADSLLVYIEPKEPIRVPLDIVECFFLGQGGASELPKIDGMEPETSNVIVRIAERAKDWHHRDVKPAIAHWCEGYITLQGAWCEPINGEALKELNHRLAAAHREQRARQAAGA